MKPRIDLMRGSAKTLQSLLAVQAIVEAGGLDAKLLHMVEMRASQINGCAYCLDMHSKDARAAGETEQRLYGLEAWRETPYFSDRERAALEWTEAVTLVSTTHVPDSAYEVVRAEFSEDEIKTLTLAAAMINLWNRLNVALRTVPGDYEPGMFREQKRAQARSA
jgi:AhpD family alkylhydroperoxidase